MCTAGNSTNVTATTSSCTDVNSSMGGNLTTSFTSAANTSTVTVPVNTATTIQTIPTSSSTAISEAAMSHGTTSHSGSGDASTTINPSTSTDIHLPASTDDQDKNKFPVAVVAEAVVIILLFLAFLITLIFLIKMRMEAKRRKSSSNDTDDHQNVCDDDSHMTYDVAYRPNATQQGKVSQGALSSIGDWQSGDTPADRYFNVTSNRIVPDCKEEPKGVPKFSETPKNSYEVITDTSKSDRSIFQIGPADVYNHLQSTPPQTQFNHREIGVRCYPEGSVEVTSPNKRKERYEAYEYTTTNSEYSHLEKRGGGFTVF